MSGELQRGTARHRLTARQLVEQLGEPEAARMMLLFGGRQVPRLPKYHGAHVDRDRAICAALDAGLSYRAAGQRFGLSAARIRAIYNRLR